MENATQNNDVAEGMIFLSVVVVLLLTCLFCNGLILAVFFLERTIRNQTNIFVVSLACADLVVASISMTLWIVDSDPVIIIPYKWIVSVDLMCCSASIFSCTLLSLERVLKITWPYWYLNTATTERVKYVISFGWIAAILIGGLSLTRGANPSNIPYICFISLVIYALPVLIISVSYIIIFCVARKHSQSIRRENRRIAGSSSQTAHSDTKTAWRLGIFIAIFIICWTPTFIKIWARALSSNPLPVEFHVLASTLPYLNAAINPFMYALGTSVFRKAMKKTFRKKMVLQNTKNSRKRTQETSTFQTNIFQGSPKSDRKEIVSSPKFIALRKYVSLTQIPMENTSRQSDVSMWETSL